MSDAREELTPGPQLSAAPMLKEQGWCSECGRCQKHRRGCPFACDACRGEHKWTECPGLNDHVMASLKAGDPIWRKGWFLQNEKHVREGFFRA